jgi:bifunctional N-acetylglucosamine-1-phosphate-uridyltransferase/glucosamine-1-phosphate-acetyltransferase GlmU-like protein
LVSSNTIGRLLSSVKDRKTFALVQSYTDDLSGHIIETDGRIERIIQRRLNPDLATARMATDVGFYAFNNTEEFRQHLSGIRKANVRNEFMFADVVSVLSEAGWRIVSVEETPDRACGINNAGELLSAVTGAGRHLIGDTEIGEIRRTLNNDYKMKELDVQGIQAFRAGVRDHVGPLHFFDWWDQFWQ